MNAYPAKKPMKASTRLFILSCIIFILSYAAIVAIVNYSMRQQALVEAESKCKIMSEQYFAIHTYFSQKLKPALFKLVEPIVSKEYFEPSWMSSTYAVREIHKIAAANGVGEYYIRDIAINARSPENEATPFEREFISTLNENPKLKEQKSIEVVDGEPYLVVLRRGEMMEEACLSCHGSPGQAPGDMVRLYGPERSFNRKIGDVVCAISIRVPLSSAYTEANRLSLKLSLALLPFLFMIFWVYTWQVKLLIIRPLSMIHDKALEITGSNERLGEQIPLPSGRELNELTAAFNKMSVSLRDHIDNLDKLVHERTSALVLINDQLQQKITEHKRAEKQIRILAGLVDIAPAAITVHDLDGDFLYANQTNLDLHGYSKEEFLALNLRDIDVPESAALIEARIKQIMEAGTLSFEASHYRKDHSTFPLHVFVKLTEWGGKKVFFSIASDITERKQVEEAVRTALAEKEVLLKEVHHRVKNNLQIISSLLNLQVNKIQSPELKMLFNETRGRIRSISYIHELLSATKDFSKINCSEYIGKLVNDLASAAKAKSNEIKITVNADITLPVDTAIPLGLITNELVTNALKYAFPHEGGGELSISLTKSDDLITLSVKDNGAGLPEGFDCSNTGTLGLQLVSGIAKQIGGTFRISSDRGTEAVVTFNHKGDSNEKEDSHSRRRSNSCHGAKERV